MAKDIGEGRWRDYGQDAVFDYCEEDVKRSAELLRRQIRGSNRFPRVDTDRVIFWSEYSAKAVARIQAKGIPIDMSAQAELTIFETLGWPFPSHVFDLHTAYLASSNITIP